MTIDSLSNNAKITDLSRTPRDKNHDVKPVSSESPSSGLPSNVDIVRVGSPKVFEQADNFNQNASSLSGSTLTEKSAIHAYESIAKEQSRESIQLLLGVDTFV